MVPDCAGFQYMKLAFNPRSILLKPCVNDLSLTQYGLPFKLVVAVVTELQQQRTSPSTSYGRCSFMEPNGSRQESLSESRLYVCDSTTPPFQHLFKQDVNLCIHIWGFVLSVFLILSYFPNLVCELAAKLYMCIGVFQCMLLLWYCHAIPFWNIMKNKLQFLVHF
jgi:hypothetical protein